MPTTFERRLEAWMDARAKYLHLRIQRDATPCQFYQRGDCEDGGVPKCWHAVLPHDEWCDGCKVRDSIYQKFVCARRAMKREFQQLCRVVDADLRGRQED